MAVKINKSFQNAVIGLAAAGGFALLVANSDKFTDVIDAVASEVAAAASEIPGP